MKIYRVQPLDFMQKINSKYHEPFIYAKIEFERALKKDRLLNAVSMLAEAFPLIKCRYVPEQNIYAENESFTPTDIFCAIDDEAGLPNLLTAQFDILNRLIEITLCGKFLVIAASHLLCDGSGLKTLLYILCSFYNNNPIEYKSLAERDLFYVLKEADKKISTVRMLKDTVFSYKNLPVYEKAENEKIYIIEKEIPPAVIRTAHIRAGFEMCTLNDVFMAAYARAQCALY